jgi:4-amino-4-deoxy-L-arabinose transferase-like glycosyltransferase
LLFVFLLAFLPRAVYPVSRPMQWHGRAVRFLDAVLEQDWAETYQRYHPGVSTMWLSGLGLKVFAWREGVTSEQLIGSAPTKPGVIGDSVTAGVIPLALVTALCIALAYVLIGRIAGARAALAGSCLLALDPFHVAYSKVLHIDALLATFMLTSALFLLSYLRESNRRDLVLSGVFAGLAFLTKSPSFFLVPYAAMAVGLHRLAVDPISGRREWIRWFRRAVWVLILWGAVACVTFVALWPAMWVEPLHALRRVVERILFHVETAHYNPIFFNGEITQQDPGPVFYVATLAWKTTLVTLPALLATIVFLVRRLRQGKKDVVPWLLVAYVVFFTAQMCLSARKEIRYLLPAFPALDVVAALGVAWIADGVGRVGERVGWQGLPSAAVGAVVALQALLVLPGHPYYGPLHNRLLGGSQVAQHILPLQDQGEGLDLAARFLNGLPRAQQATAWLYRRSDEIFRRTFLGKTSMTDVSQADYRVYSVNQVMRRLGDEAWEETWQSDRQQEPLWTAAFGGVTYVWVYGSPPKELAAGGPEYVLHHQLGDHIRLDRVRISAETLTAGDTLIVVPVWSSDGNVETSYKVFCHILSQRGELVAQRDAFPLDGVRETPSWRSGELIEDVYEVQLSAGLPPGEYELSLGMYDPAGMKRLPVYDSTGKRVPHDRVVVAPVRVEAAEPEDG